MLNLREYRNKPATLADYLPWAALVAPGVVLNKDGSFQRTARFRGPDLESATPAELIAACARLNNALRRLGSGWALFVEAERYAAADYPASTWPDPVSWLVDEERRAAFEGQTSLSFAGHDDAHARREHFESTYHLTLVHLPPAETTRRFEALLLDRPQGAERVDGREHLEGFIRETNRLLDLMGDLLPELEPLDDAATLTYLHGTISTKRHPVQVPETPMHLDAVLADTPLVGGLEPRLGDQHLRTLTIQGFPGSTTPGLLDELNQLGIGYRWVVRFLPLDKAEATKALTKYRRLWFAKRKSVAQILREILFQEQQVLVDSDADNKAIDADAALQELGDDLVSYGYLTVTVTVTAADPDIVEEEARLAERVINARGFTTINETLNAVEAWLGSLPGHAYANVRQPLVNSLNLAHLMPLSAVWAGPAWNDHLDGPPLLHAETAGHTPFRLSTHVGDVGHTLVVGPTGAGKSVLLALMALQFRRYPNAQINIFDKGASSRAAVLGMGGQFFALSADGSLAFQPLARIDDAHVCTWAAEWVQGLLAHEGIELTPEVKEAVWSGLLSLRSAPTDERTITGLAILLQSQALKQALQPYTLDGPFGHLLDADQDRLEVGSVQAFEMEELMHAKALILPVLTYLFHRLEDQFDGRPGMLILDEAWLFLDHPLFAARIREWLKTLRKQNVAVVFATQSLADIANSTIAPAIIESCLTRIFLPNDRAIEPEQRTIYGRFGLNDRQIELIAGAVPKRDYYLQSRAGNRLFELGLGPVARAFCGASSKQDQRLISDMLDAHGADGFATAYLRARQLDWAADLLGAFPDQHPAIGTARAA